MYISIIKTEISLSRYKLFSKCELYKKKTLFSDGGIKNL